MRKLALFLTTPILAVAIGGAAFAELKVHESVTSEDTKPYVKKERFITKIATVEAVDVKLRVVTLKQDNGKIFDVRVVPEVKNLAQLKKGDLVAIRYHEAVSAQVYKAGEAPRITEAASALETAKPGEKPGGKYLYKTTTTATIESINMKKPEVTLKTVDGKTLTVKVERPKLLANVKVGDEVVITYSEAVAVSVTKKK